MGTIPLILLFQIAGGVGDPAEAGEQPYGIEKRVLWTASRVVGSPDPPLPYTTQLAFPHLRLNEAVTMTLGPDGDRFFVAERPGRVVSFPDDSSARAYEVFLDLRRPDIELLGLAFHPKYDENGYVYLFINQRTPAPPRTRITRFRVDPENLRRCDPKSEYILLDFVSSGHNGGCLMFGPDGYLYIGVGDGGGSNDVHNTGQFIGDLLASILRIDVNRPDPGTGRGVPTPYSIPPDNPFVDTPGARPEIWAYGLRQPWQFSFDRRTGELWVGEVGQDLWESVYRVERGGNYGWSIMEGPQAFRPRRERGPTPIISPVMAHAHGESRSLTGGFIYRGSRLKDLIGAYVYADYETGKIWALRYDGTQVTWHRELADTTFDIAGFAEDADGELYVVTYFGGRVHRLVPAPERPARTEFPRRLSETGLFRSVADLTPAPGLIPYSVNAPLWSDGAGKERFIALPGAAQVEYRDERGWRFPEGTVLVKTFNLEMTAGDPNSARRLETRLFTRQNGQWAGYTYVWNDEQTDAMLLDKAGLKRTYTITDPSAPGGRRTQVWDFPSRADCMLCHNEKGGFVLGLSTRQMNRDHAYGGVTANQLRTLDHLGIFAKPLPETPSTLPRLADPDDTSADLDRRARAYLHANCVHCHRTKGGGNSDFKLMDYLPLEETATIDVPPTHGDFEISDARLIAPGAPERSLISYRMALRGPGRMPHIGTLEVDAIGLRLIRDWIRGMAPDSQAAASVE